MDLHAQIRNFYISNVADLPAIKQFHFATRLAAWSGDAEAFTLLRSLRPHYVPEPYDTQAVRNTLHELINNPPQEHKNAANLRAEYFAKYPSLDGLHLALFRVRHLRYVYGIDVRPVFFELAPKDDCLRLEQQLLGDPDAMRILSTYAINYLYLLERILLEHDPSSIDVEGLYRLADGYSTEDPHHLQLLIYLYTHCIIGETNFYTRRIPGEILPTYQKMLKRLESLIGEHYDDINLDNKLEFLVCCRICGLDSDLFARVEDECQRSVSHEGHFLVDTHNNHQQSHRTSFSESEHRNVLYIMSGSAFAPHSTNV